MFIAFIVIIILCAVLLVVVVLAQNSKGGGVTSQFGGSGASQLIGVKKTGDLLEKLTWGFVFAIIIFSISSTVLIDKNSISKNSNLDPDIEKAIENPNSNLQLKSNEPLKVKPTDSIK
jgi:preprotein translocase subunit SecG